MNTRLAHPGRAADLAAGPQAGLWAFVVGLVVVLVLVGGFALGYRGRTRDDRPPLPAEQPRGRNRQSHEEGTPRPHDSFPPDRRLRPHELGGDRLDASSPGRPRSRRRRDG